MTDRKKGEDYQIRRRRSLRAGWYNYFIFYPNSVIPRKMLYTIWQQLKNHTFNGNMKATFAMFQAILDLFINSFNIYKTSNRFTFREYNEYCNLPNAKIYWQPNKEK